MPIALRIVVALLLLPALCGGGQRRPEDDDLLLAGNMTETCVRFANHNANHDVLLRGDVRAIASLGDQLLFRGNRDSLAAYCPTGAAPPAASAVRARRTDR